MSNSDPYFQFPVSALRLGKSIDDVTQAEMRTRLHDIIAYCMVDVGRKYCQKTNDDDAKKRAGNYAERNGIGGAIGTDGVIVYCGADILQVKLGPSAKHEIQSAKRISVGQSNMTIRMRNDYVWGAINCEDKTWTWRRFACLAGVYAAIGGYHVHRVSLEYVRKLAHGFTSNTSFDEAKADEYALPERGMRWTVDKLHKEGFFVRACPNGRHAWYSNSLSESELINALAAKISKPKMSPKSINQAILERAEKLRATK